MKSLRIVSTAILGLLAGHVHGAGLFLIPSTPTHYVADGDVVSFDILLDLSDYPNGTLGGSFDIYWDSSALSLLGFDRDESVGDPLYSRDPEVLDGLLFSWGVADFNVLPLEAVLGSVSFEVLPAMGVDTTVGTWQSAGIGAGWVDASGLDFIPMTYGDAVVSRVPLPAAGGLLLFALACAATVGRSKDSTDRKSGILENSN